MRWLWLVAIAACGGGDNPPIDAAPISIDAAVCAMPADCPCFSNYDCPPAFACVSANGTVSCVAGQRGTGAAGAVCFGEADCASALCVEDATNGMRCSDVCHTAATCPPELPRCISLGGEGICAREPPSQLWTASPQGGAVTTSRSRGYQAPTAF